MPLLVDKTNVWASLTEPILASTFDGEDGISESAMIRRRLDSIVPGEWDCMLELLPPPVPGAFAFKSRMQILGVIREAAADGNTYARASAAAFRAAALLFGVEVADDHA